MLKYLAMHVSAKQITTSLHMHMYVSAEEGICNCDAQNPARPLQYLLETMARCFVEGVSARRVTVMNHVLCKLR